MDRKKKIENRALNPLRLSRALGTTPQLWLNLQKNYDLWQAEYASTDWRRVRPFSEQILHPDL